MSNAAIDWAWEQGVRPLEKSVLVFLANKANGDNVCWPGINSIARGCSIHRATVFRVLVELDKAKLIVRDGRIFTLKVAHGNIESQPATSETVAVGDSESHTATKSRGVRPLMLRTATHNPKEPSLNPQEPKAPRATKGKTALPDNFEITTSMRDWFREKIGNVSTRLVMEVHEDWLDYIRRDDVRHKDWLAAWRSGMRKAKEWGKFTGADPPAIGSGRKQTRMEGQMQSIKEVLDEQSESTGMVHEGDGDWDGLPNRSEAKLLTGPR